MKKENNKYNTAIPDMAEFFKILGDNTRLRIMLLIDEQRLCVNDIASKLEMTKSAVSHQLALLRASKLIHSPSPSESKYILTTSTSLLNLAGN